MSEGGYKGIQLSLKRAGDNALLNIAGATIEEFAAVKAALKSDPDLAGFFTPATPTAPTLQVVPTAPAAPARAAARPAPSSDGSEPAPVCETCGATKTWKPGGTSRAGKPYSGFWGCPNYRDGSHG